MNNQDILDKAPEGALGIKIMDGFYRWVLKDNTQSKIYGCEAFFDCNQIYRSLADIKHNVELEKEVVKANMKLIDCALDIAELEKEVKHLNQVAYNTSKVSFEAGACCPYVDFHEHAILFAKKITKEQGE